MDLKVWKEILNLKFSWFVYAVIVIVLVTDWTGIVDGSSSILALMLFWFYYEINSKDLQLRDLNNSENTTE